MGLFFLLLLLFWYRRRRQRQRIISLFYSPDQPEMGSATPSVLVIGRSSTTRTRQLSASSADYPYVATSRESISSPNRSQIDGHLEETIINGSLGSENPFADPHPTSANPFINSQPVTSPSSSDPQTQMLGPKLVRVSQRFSKTSSNRSIRVSFYSSIVSVDDMLKISNTTVWICVVILIRSLYTHYILIRFGLHIPCFCIGYYVCWRRHCMFAAIAVPQSIV